GLVVFFYLNWVQNTVSQNESSQPTPEVSIQPDTSSSIEPSILNPQHALLKLDTPIAGEVISSPLVVTGAAKGFWFFEASFPVILTNWDGLIIAEGVATAQGDWMTEE